MKSKKTKRALVSSALALVLCFVMLLGTTFAWFTDNASTSVNKVQAGTLDVALEMATAWDKDGKVTKWESAEGKTLDFVKATGHESESILWEPGCTYKLPELRIVNEGNLAVKYVVEITGIKGDAELNKAIDWTIGDVAQGTEQKLAAGANAEFTISGTMQTTAGNTYQGKSIEGIAITVYAAQDTVEYDSNDNQYDKNATYEVITKDVSASGTKADIENAIKEAVEEANNKPGATEVVINLTNDEATTTGDTSVTIDSSALKDAKNLTFNLGENVKLAIYDTDKGNLNKGLYCYSLQNGQTLKITGEGTITNAYLGVYSGSTLVVENEGGFVQGNMGNAMIRLAGHGATVVIKNMELKNHTTSRHPLITVGDVSTWDTDGVTPSTITLENVTMDGTTHFSSGKTAQDPGIWVSSGSCNVITRNVTFNGSSSLTTSFGGWTANAFLSTNNKTTVYLNGVLLTSN